MRAQQIIRLACDIKSVWKTNNPFEIAEKYGIKVNPECEYRGL